MATNKIYDLLEKFPEYEQKMNQCKKPNNDQKNNDNICDSFNTGIFGFSDEKALVGKCSQIICYLESILNKDKTRFSEFGCKYFNYWLYNEVLKKKYINGILIFYQTFIDNFMNVFHKDAVLEAKRKYIQDKDLAKITAIADMNECLDAKKSKGQYITNDYFCKALEEFIHKYNIETQYKDSISAASHKISRCKTNTSASTIIPTIIILLIPTLLFMLYKFSPYDSCFRRGITKILNKWHNMIEKEMDILQQTDTSNSFSWDARYNMLYNST